MDTVTALISAAKDIEISKNKSFKINKEIEFEKVEKFKSPAPCWTDEEFNRLAYKQINVELYSYIKELQQIGWEEWKKRLQGSRK